MSYIPGTPREQLMLPSSIDEYGSSDHIVRFIDAFVDKVLTTTPVSLSSKGKSLEGRPSYPPKCLCKLLIYGYLNSISSSRKLESETKRNLEVMWLMHNLHPDHRTISDFRKENKAQIKRLTLDLRRFLKDNGYIQGKSLSTDGTKIKAYASRDILSLKLIDKKLAQVEKEIDRYFSQLNENDAIETEQEEMLATSDALKRQIAHLQEEMQTLQSQKDLLEKSGRQSLAPADPDAKVMKTKDGFLPAYNVQATVDNASHFLTSCQVTDYPNDFHSLKENVDTLREQLDIVPQTYLADSGYANEEDIQLLEEQEIECIVSFPDEPESKRIRRDNGITFTFDETTDCFKCSQGKTLLPVAKNCRKKNHFYDRYQCNECDKCHVRQYCTTSKTGRTIYRRLNGKWLNSYKGKQKTKEFKEKFRKRKCVAEHPFGTMRYYMGQIPVLLRGKEKVQVEIDLYSTAYNLTRLKNIETVPVLLKKLAKWNPVSCFFVFFSFLFSKKSMKPIFVTQTAFIATF